MLNKILASRSLTATEDRYLQEALGVAKWLRASAIKDKTRSIWPSDPSEPASVNPSLYQGVPGVVLFFLELYRASGDRTYLNDARNGADYLLDNLAQGKDCGFYVGLSGIAFTLEETYRVTKNRRYRQGVVECLRLINVYARRVGAGVEWDEYTDIIFGSAGIGLFLLYIAKQLKARAATELAILAGRRLIDLAERDSNGSKWKMSAKEKLLMPNFSHGTAGVAYFLATLYKETKEREFLDAAISGAKQLISIAKTDNNQCLIFHHEPGGEDLYYLGWCHGPVGSARLFYQLYKVTGDSNWMEWVNRGAAAILNSGIPEIQTPGFWNNVGQCCGSAGVGDFFLNLYRLSGKKRHLNFSKKMARDIMARATRDSQGVRWFQAEFRKNPALLVAQTGYMQGASGIGLFFLHINSLQQGRERDIKLLDSPF